jgi:hypothetical protein
MEYNKKVHTGSVVDPKRLFRIRIHLFRLFRIQISILIRLRFRIRILFGILHELFSNIYNINFTVVLVPSHFTPEIMTKYNHFLNEDKAFSNIKLVRVP